MSIKNKVILEHEKAKQEIMQRFTNTRNNKKLTSDAKWAYIHLVRMKKILKGEIEIISVF
jgi:hypothetical protein